MQARWGLFAGALALAVAMFSTAVGAAGPALASGTRSGSIAHVASEQTAAVGKAREFLSRIKLGTPFHASRAFRGYARGPISPLSTTNWSGYADRGPANSFTTVSGSWVEPTATCGSGISLAAFWVGIDGISSADPTVQQVGTLIECMGGTASYYDWWETYPKNAVQLQKIVSPGDVISAQVTYNGSYSMSVTDSSNTGASFAVVAPCGAALCQNESAEWIAEAPCCKSGSTVYDLSNFERWRATNSETTYEGILGSILSAPTIYEISMIDSSKEVKAKPTALKDAGGSFKVKWIRGN
jgi:hypothetical protein